MRNEELHKVLLQILEGQAEFKADMRTVKENLHEIKETDIQQFKELEQIRLEKARQNGRVGKNEDAINAIKEQIKEIKEIDKDQDTKIEKQSVGAFLKDNIKWIVILALAIVTGNIDKILNL